nr:ribonuclease H-like domain-containing protein [Tanacetum cinerariifolium]
MALTMLVNSKRFILAFSVDFLVVSALRLAPGMTHVDIESKLGSDGELVCLYMHDARDPHFTALKRIIRYVHGTLDYGLQLHVSTVALTAYTDVDWVVCHGTSRSTSGYCVFLGGYHLSWYAKRHVTLSCSIADEENCDVANVVVETTWIRNLLRGLHIPLSTTTLVYCVNVSV